MAFVLEHALQKEDDKANSSNLSYSPSCGKAVTSVVVVPSLQ